MVHRLQMPLLLGIVINQEQTRPEDDVCHLGGAPRQGLETRMLATPAHRALKKVPSDLSMLGTFVVPIVDDEHPR